MSQENRKYLESHPWINFTIDTRRFSAPLWLLLGEAVSKSDHIAGAPLAPAVAKQLMSVSLTKGAHGTTSIEGNTLTEEQVRDRIDGQLDLPISREYLGKEIDNIVSCYNLVLNQTVGNANLPAMNTATLKEYHRKLMEGQPLKEGVVPGEFRTHSVGVGSYRGAPAEDCDYLSDKLFDWLNTSFVPDSPEYKRPMSIVRAIIAHLYIAWIHPFGDGNGRMARLIEFRYLVEAGLPLPVCHALSDHYNNTRDAYYSALAATSQKPGYPVEEFIQYAVQGLVDEVKEQLDRVRDHQLQVAWRNFVHEAFKGQETVARRRQRNIVLDLPWEGYTSLEKIRNLSDRVADGFTGKSTKTVTRDINALLKMDLVMQQGKAICPRKERMSAFLPPHM